MSRDDINDATLEHLDRLVGRLEDMASCPLILDLAIHLKRVKEDLNVIQKSFLGLESRVEDIELCMDEDNWMHES